MAAFITGLLIGGFVGFLICAACAGSGSGNGAKNPNGETNGEKIDNEQN